MNTEATTYQKYTSYKDSQVEWLGDIPESWSLSPLKYLFRETSDKGYPDLQLLSVYRDHGVVPTDSRDDNHNVPSEDLSGYKKIEVGNLVTNKMKAWQGSICISNYKGIVSPAYYIYKRTEEENNPRYFHYLLRSSIYISVYKANSKGIRPGQWDLEKKFFERVPIIIPNVETQNKITTLLDSKIDIIDGIIAKKQKLIDLLQEKRQALITQAVTKGLDPNAKMKDSGVEWIGKIPESWKIKKIKFIADLYTGNSISDEGKAEFDVESDGFPYISTKDIDLIFSTIDYDNGMLIPKNRKDFKVAAEDSILLCIEGGSAGKKIGYTDRQVCFVNKLCCIKSRKDNRYIYYYFKTKNCRGYFELSITGLIGGVSTQRLKEFFCPYPTAREKEIISNYLDSKMEVIDKSMVLLISQIEKLSEFKSALIYNAVTGKIKV